MRIAGRKEGVDWGQAKEGEATCGRFSCRAQSSYRCTSPAVQYARQGVQRPHSLCPVGEHQRPPLHLPPVVPILLVVVQVVRQGAAVQLQAHHGMGGVGGREHGLRGWAGGTGGADMGGRVGRRYSSWGCGAGQGLRHTLSGVVFLASQRRNATQTTFGGKMGTCPIP